MPKVWIRRVAQPRYVVPVAGWVGCVFLLKVMVAGMGAQGLIKPLADEGGRMAVLEMRTTVGDETVRSAAAKPAPRPAISGPRPAEADAEFARQDDSEAPI